MNEASSTDATSGGNRGNQKVQFENGSEVICVSATPMRHAATVPATGAVTPATPIGAMVKSIAVVPEPIESPPQRRSLVSGKEVRSLKPEDQKVDRSARPGWITAAERIPEVGSDVYCTAGPGAVLRVLGKTGNGSRLLEVKLASGARGSFFAAASNVLIAPRQA